MSLIKHSAKDCYAVTCDTTKIILSRLQHAVQLDVSVVTCATICVTVYHHMCNCV